MSGSARPNFVDPQIVGFFAPSPAFLAFPALPFPAFLVRVCLGLCATPILSNMLIPEARAVMGQK